MIEGSGELHWCTFFDEDGDPFGETCRCPVGVNHLEHELPAGTPRFPTDAFRPLPPAAQEPM